MRSTPTQKYLPAREPKAPLAQLKRWPTAWRPDEDCRIDNVLYPAPDSLDVSDVAWWLDCTQSRLDFSRSFVSGLALVGMGALFGLVPYLTFEARAGWTWASSTSVPAAVAVVVILIGLLPMIRRSEHRALEQRWLLYRERARQLDALETRELALSVRDSDQRRPRHHTI